MLSASLHPYFPSSFERHSSFQLNAWLNTQQWSWPHEEVYYLSQVYYLSMRWGGNPLNSKFNMLCGFCNPIVWRCMLASAKASVVLLCFPLPRKLKSYREVLVLSGQVTGVWDERATPRIHKSFLWYICTTHSLYRNSFIIFDQHCICTSCRVQ